MKRKSSTIRAARVLALSWFVLWPAEATEDFRVFETGTELQVVTPFGKKTISGDFPIETSSNYRIEIPIQDLMPEKKDRPWERSLASPEEFGFQKPSSRAAEAYDDTDKLVLEANRLYNQGRYYDATLVVETIIKKNPKYARAWLMKGSLMYVQGQKDLAKKAWEEAKALSPNDAEILTALERYK